jgi:hypothetical protein
MSPTIARPRSRAGILAAILFLAYACIGTRLAGQPLPGTRNDPAQVAEEVFQGSEFWWKRLERIDAAAPGWLERLWTAIADALGRFFQALWELLVKWLRSLLHLLPGSWSLGKPAVGLIVVILLGWSIWKLYPRLMQWLRPDAKPGPQVDGFNYRELPEAMSLYALARQALADQRYEEAVRLALLALIARFQHLELLRYDPARTNREYQEDLRDVPDLAGLFRRIAEPYERIWYGRAPATRSMAEKVLDSCRSTVIEELSLDKA